MRSQSAAGKPPELERGLGLLQATSLNIANMIGAGPFITIPAFVAAMQGPQALVGWVVAAVLVLCDGLVWSELGAALPGSGGSYHFLVRAYSHTQLGRVLPFLFIWQFLISGTMEMASGYIGGVNFLDYLFPKLTEQLAQWHVPGGKATLAAACAIVVAWVLCRRIRTLGWLSVALCAGTLATVLAIIVSGVLHFRLELVDFPQNAFHVDRNFLYGLGGAMAIAVYDYLGYFNVCHLGDEVIRPERTIPRAVVLSILIVAAVYLTMNASILGVVPWRKAMVSANIAAEFMETLYGPTVAAAFTWLILWTVVACLFAITLGYSRIPYAAARDGAFFRVFATVHAEKRYPVVSLAVIGLLTAAFCYLDLGTVISAAVIVRIGVQFIGQIAGLHLVRTTRPDIKLPFRMWLYPVPALAALLGWLFVLFTTEPNILGMAAGVLGTGCVAFGAWRYAQERV